MLALVLLLAWMAAASLSVTGTNGFMLETPALYFSVGQEFQPRLISLSATAAAPPSTVSLELLNARGTAIAKQLVSLNAAATALGSAFALPRAGDYLLRANSDAGAQTIPLHALPEPDARYGGVLAVASLGLSSGASDYLREHGFAVSELAAGAAPRLIVVGDPRLEEANLVEDYTALWRAVAAGSDLLLLDPIPPGAAEFWPIAGPYSRDSAICGEDAFAPPFTEGLEAGTSLATLLRPALTFDLAQQSQLDIYHWDGRRLLRPTSHSGYSGCHALFSFRLGAGWVTYSTLPLLQHFQDVRARIYLMNLIQAMAKRKRSVPESPGLAWVMDQRMKQAAQAPAPAGAAIAVFYRPPPARTAPAPVLEPAASAGRECAPEDETRPGASWTLNLAAAQSVQGLNLDLRPAPGSDAYELAASSDGAHWTDLPGTNAANPGASTVAIPDGRWKAFRLTVPLGVPTPHWRFCGLTPVG